MDNIHKVDNPTSMNYASVVSRDSARIILNLDVLNKLDIHYAYV